MKKHYTYTFLFFCSFIFYKAQCQTSDSGALKIKYPTSKDLNSNLIFADSLRLMEDFKKDEQIKNFIHNQGGCDCSFVASISLKYNNKRFIIVNPNYKNEFEKLVFGFVNAHFKNYEIRKKEKSKNISSYKNRFWMSVVLNLENDTNVSITIKEFKQGYSSLVGNYTSDFYL